MMEKHYSILFTIIGFFHLTYGCSIDGVSWLVPVTKQIFDTDRGEVFSGQTRDIQAITTVTQREGLNRGPYFNVSLEDTLLSIKTNPDFEKYEEYETQLSLGYTITLRCTDSTTRNLVFVINLTDTNNHDPIFLPTDNYEFTIAPPVPPGFMITTCLNDILVRDIDLTTHKIDFKIEGSDLFEISFNPSSQVPKEFKATLKTTDLIRSIPEPIKLTVTATDVDKTEGPPRTASATVVIAADSQFQFPDEPIFSQPFYLASYKTDNDIILQDKIFLRQGYDKDVEFSFESDHSEYFNLDIDENNLSFSIKSPIPVRLYAERQIYLIVKATREHTSGAAATVILKLPEETPLEFENAIYEGIITDNVLQLTDLKLKQGYEGFKITVDVKSEYTFRANIESNVIKISMDPLPADVIQNNNFIHLQVTASNNRTTAVTVVILEIVKDDYTTPVFENNFYSGSYSTETGLTLEQIVINQGFDSTVKISLEEEHSKYFKINQDGPKITLTASIPPDIFNERNIMISVLASKPRTVGAHAAVKISLPTEPPEIDVSFDQILYNGKLQNGVLSHDKITLSGFDGTNIEITGEHSALFKSELTNGVVKIETTGADFPKNLPYILLELQAASAKAMLLIDVSLSEPPEIDVSFDQILYNGKLQDGVLSHDNITLSGFDGTNIEITGEHSALFKSELTNGVVKIETTGADFPKNLPYILLELQAASAKAMLLIDVSLSEPPEIDVSFDQILYNGKLQDGVLSHDNITLSGFDGTNIEITGEHSALFKSELTNGVVKIETTGEDFPKNVSYILLELQAASAKAMLLIDVSLSEPPEIDVSFDQILYNGKLQNGVLSHDKITLSGFDGTNIEITGEHSALFKSELTNGVVKIETTGADFPKNLPYILLELQAASAKAMLLIDVSLSEPPEIDVSFDQILYNGKLQNGVLSHDNITLSGFDGTNIEITGEHSALFKSELTNGVVKIETTGEDFPKNVSYILLELQAASAKAMLLIDVSLSEPPEIDVSFDQILYNGKLQNGVLSHDKITLSGFDGTNIEITGEHSALFKSELTNGVVKIETTGADFPKNLPYILLELQAASAKAMLLIDVSLSEPPEIDVSFDQILYNGKLQNGVLSHDNITLSGFDGKNIEITGEHSALFKSELLNGAVKIEATGADFPKNIPYILLELQAASAKAKLLIDVSLSEPPEIEVSFDQILYNGKLQDGVLSHDEITLSGFEGTNIEITGEQSALFKSELLNGVVKIEATGADFPKNLPYILLELQAVSAEAILLIEVSFTEPPEIDDVSFDQILYNGKLQDGVLSHDKITLSGFDGTNIEITGEHSALFKSELTNGVVKIEVTGADFPKNLQYILLELHAASAKAMLLIDVGLLEPPEVDVYFDQILYNGKLHDGVLSHDKITLSGFDGTNIEITGEHNTLFRSELTNGVVKVEASGGDFPRDLTYINLELQAASAKAILLIEVSFSVPPEIDDVSFDQILYNGKLQDGVLSHDKITLSGFNGTNIQITGEHNALFRSELTNGVVKLEASGEDFPKDLTYILLELEAASAKAILLIEVSFSENPDLPIVSFTSQSYFLWADVQQTGVVGAVEATADNGEAISYSLSDVNEHIQSRININGNGEILLTAAFDVGVYKFNAIATSVKSQVQATAPVLLRVDTLPECINDAGLSPLIILERLEEEPHFNLVVLNQTSHRGCTYILSNVYPKDQSWLYIENDGLHAKAIDREDRSIAFMTLSQIQVELTLDCDSDEEALTKRSFGTEDRSDLYNEGPNKWVLTDTITFNARRSFVNLIVKDINDNSPIFLGKGNEPIYVGYPVSELEGTVSPRALAELKATDADIGENAAIMYWSREDKLAVSPNTGSVHVRNNAQLENNSRLTIYAIDQNGRGRNGTIDIVVKLLDKNQIVVLTVKDAFLEDEVDVLNELSKAVEYEIKVLKAVVIPNNEDLSRRKHEVANNSRASLQLYVYGLLENEPVDINQLTRDINNVNVGTINIARIVSLEDHLKDLEIGPASGRDTGLLAATIVLAILLFIVIVAIAVRFFLIWKKRRTEYKKFSNRYSNESQLSSPNVPKIEVVPKPRPNIDEIKRTERRLQKMLEMPIENPIVPQANNNVQPLVANLDDAKVNISPPDTQSPIVIQSIDKLKDKTEESDDNDEFGEVTKPRKSVVTFNENVEKIIHIEDVPDDTSSQNSLQIYKL